MSAAPGAGTQDSGANPWPLLPPLDDETYAALKTDIAAHGLRVPIVVDAESGSIIDGHHRQRAVQELRTEGVRVPEFRDVRRFADDDERAEFLLKANLLRRHLTRTRRAEVVAQLRERGWSQRRIGDVLGVDHMTVRTDLARIGEIRQSPFPERVERRGGGTYPARRPTPSPSVVVGSKRDEGRARASLTALGDEARGGPIPLLKAERLARGADHRRRQATITPLHSAEGERWELRCGDFATALDDLEPGSVDMMLTDPPYEHDFLDRWADLSALAARTLKPGGVAVFYTGYQYLPDVISQLGSHLTWLWHMALVHPGRESSLNALKVKNSHRGLLVFTNGPRSNGRWLKDTITVAPWDTSLHRWQQSVEPATYLIQVLSEPGGLILDPCSGAATFGVAALSQDRRYLGIDINPTMVAVAAERLRASSQ